MFVYIRDGGIVAKTDKEDRSIIFNLQIETNIYKITDMIIYEDSVLKLYKDSNQYKEDKGIIGLEEKNKILQDKLKNQKLKTENLMVDNIRLKTEFDLLRKMHEND